MKHTSLSACLLLALFGTVSAQADMNFNRIASFATPNNMAGDDDQSRETSAEIIKATRDGMTVVYTDSPLGVIGLVDISDAENPKALGNVDVGGEPTSVVPTSSSLLVAVNTSESYIAPSGVVKAFSLDGSAELGSCDLQGQPDSIAVAKDDSFVVIAIENERDEDLNGGVIPQAPAGNVLMFALTDGNLDCASKIVVDLTGITAVAPTDPEPEFVDVNSLGEVVVTLQENNHLAVISKSGELLHHFSAGAVDLEAVDLKRDGALVFDQIQSGRLREPDGAKWLDDDHFIVANEGDYEGGSRGWSVFSKTGEVVYESGTSFEKAIVQIGHYPEKRSGKKGVEPESVEAAIFDGVPIAFIGAERSSVVGVYDMSSPKNPVLRQLLPSGIAPEGIVAIPERNLLVTANEKDLIEDGGVRAHVMLYEYQEAPANYPQLTSAGADTLIGWGAISGMVAHASLAGQLYAVNDSFYTMQPSIFKIDASQKPARITAAIPVTRNGAPAQKLDMEGITLDGAGGFWIASEGRSDRLLPHALYHVNAEGEIQQEIALPPELLAVEKRFGFEGVTKIGETLWMAVQREWGDDPADHVKLVSYNIKNEQWGAVLYPKAKPATGWVGLSEIVAYGDSVYVVERDNQIGAAAVTKKVYKIAQSEMVPAALGGELPVVSKQEVRDLIPDLQSFNGYVQDKVEGLAIDVDGEAFVSTDNDGVDDHSGESFFWSIGQL